MNIKGKKTTCEPTSRSDIPPAGDPGVGAVVEGAVWGSQADGQDVAGEVHRRGELQQADVVVKGSGVVVGMSSDLLHRSRHLVGV